MKNKGLHHRRIEEPINFRERLFAEQWEYENEGTTRTPLLEHILHYRVSDRDITVAATVVQWLGSNVGQSFLREVAQKAAKGSSDETI